MNQACLNSGFAAGMSLFYQRGGKHSCRQPYRRPAHCFAHVAQEAALQLDVGQPLCGASVTASV
jgi:hypothetical protein